MKFPIFLFMLFLQFPLFGQTAKSIVFLTADGGRISADLYEAGSQAVILAHGAIFNKESWQPLAAQIAKAKITVLAINFRGYGQSQSGKQTSALEEDILGAIAYLQQKGFNNISVLGASMGGGASARAAVKAAKGEIARLILLSPVPIKRPQDIHTGVTVYIASKNEGMAKSIAQQYEQSPQPKKIFWIEGTAHAQHIFKTAQAQKLTRLIIEILTE